MKNNPDRSSSQAFEFLRGANGTGTSGNDAAYSSAGWNGQTDAPSRNAVRDVAENLAQLNSGAFIPTQGGSGGFIAVIPCPPALAWIDRILQQQRDDEDVNLYLLRDWDQRFEEKHGHP